MTKETKKFLETVGLEINKEKSATNSEACGEEAKIIEGNTGYKYLGIIENASSQVLNESKDKVNKEILRRTDLICKTRLNGKNLFKAINEHAISVVNYHVGVLNY